MPDRYNWESADLMLRVDAFSVRLEDEKAEDGTRFADASSQRDHANDAAFEALDVLVGQLVSIPDGDEPVGKDSVPQLPVTVDLFHKLAKTCEASVDRIGEEFVDTTQYGGENKQLQEKIQDLSNRVESDLRAEKESLDRASSWSSTCQNDLWTAENDLRNAQSKRDVSQPEINFRYSSCSHSVLLGMVRCVFLLWRWR